MEQNIDKGVGWLQKIIGLQKKHGFFTILKGLFVLLVTAYVIFFALNPRYLLDKIEMVKTERHDDAVSRRMQVDAEIRLMLNRLLHNLDADRTWLIELHNGGKNLSSGLPFLYGDMRIEEVATGVDNVDDEYTNFSLSKYPFISKVFDDGFFCGNIESLCDIDERMYFKFKSNDVNEVALLALYSGDKPLGILGISFCGDNQMNAVEVGRSIRKCGVKVATLLSGNNQ